MFKNKNDKRPVIQSSGYNGSEPTRICPKCGKKKQLKILDIEKWKVVKFVINLGARVVEVNNKKIYHPINFNEN